MKKIILLLVVNLLIAGYSHAQLNAPTSRQIAAITALIKDYSTARENRDTVLLKRILTSDVDQLVSTGEWRNGIQSSVQGMLKSSASNAGTRTLSVEKIRMLSSDGAIVDCHYDIQNPDNSMRRMWSTFFIITNGGNWKISAIRNMLPAAQ